MYTCAAPMSLWVVRYKIEVWVETTKLLVLLYSGPDFYSNASWFSNANNNYNAIKDLIWSTHWGAVARLGLQVELVDIHFTCTWVQLDPFRLTRVQTAIGSIPTDKGGGGSFSGNICFSYTLCSPHHTQLPFEAQFWISELRHWYEYCNDMWYQNIW